MGHHPFFLVDVRKYLMKTFQEFLAQRATTEGLWLNDKNALPGMSRLNVTPFTNKKRKRHVAKIKPPKPYPAGVPTVRKIVHTQMFPKQPS